MQITSIKESGTSNILMWAIANGANIKEDEPLQSIINDETFYLVTFSNVNFFELFRLTQMYREKLRIINEHKADVPPRKELVTLFNGGAQLDENDPEKKIPLYEPVEHVINTFINLALQMNADNDIISPSAQRLFLPMISRKFDVQIPVSFIDLIQSMSEDESARMFTPEYPNTLQEIIDSDTHGVKITLQMGFLKGTSIIKYNKRYDQYLNLTKYFPLKSCNNNKLYKFGLLGFYKYDNITRGESRCSLFVPKAEQLASTLKRLGKLSTPLKIDFAVQLPIQYMQILENSFEHEVLTISYESSMSNIIDGGLVYDDFVTPDIDPDTEDPVLQDKLKTFNNTIEAYRVRIAEANQLLLNTIPIILNSDGDIDVTSTFSMLPSIYTTRAVITIDLDKADLYTKHYDPIIAEMFQEMLNSAANILNDINKAK